MSLKYDTNKPELSFECERERADNWLIGWPSVGGNSANSVYTVV